jgi:hypothetical protein
MKYTGQTVSSLKTRFQEHQRDFKHGNGKFSFAQHLLENGLDIGPIEDIMNTIFTYITNKDRLMNTLEKYYIFRETKIDNLINNKLAVRPNVIFKTIVQEDPHRGIRNIRHTGWTLLISVEPEL